MAFPTLNDADTTTGATTTNGTSFTVTYCGNIASGDLLILAIGRDGTLNSISGFPSGWTELVAESGDSQCRILAWYKIATGTETGTFDLSCATSEMYSWNMFRVSSWHGTTPPEGATPVQASTQNPDPPSLSPSWGSADTLWLAFIANDDGTVSVSGYPANYTTTRNTRGSASSAACGIGTAWREVAAASEDPGTFTLSASEGTQATTLAIRPAAGGTAHTLAATVAGVSTAAGALVQGHIVAATVAGVSTVSASLSLAAILQALVAGEATVVATLTTDAGEAAIVNVRDQFVVVHYYHGA